MHIRAKVCGRTHLILVTVPVLLFFFWQLLEQAATDYILYPYQAGVAVIFVEDNALADLLVQVRAVMMGLHLQQSLRLLGCALIHVHVRLDDYIEQSDAQQGPNECVHANTVQDPNRVFFQKSSGHFLQINVDAVVITLILCRRTSWE